jgi:hypothetical protein
VRARYAAQELVLAADELVCTGMPAQLWQFRCGLAAVGRNGVPDFGRAAAPERRDDTPSA